jgi:Ni,Fe-hydrogenase III small subunit/formate hydrogenlyase subunit 6/NADH:ubiquinone oxidoreductase subunit I
LCRKEQRCVNIFRKSLATGLVTIGYPATPEPAPPAFRGKPVLRLDRCTGEAQCAEVCPASCISVTAEPSSGGRVWTLDLAPCVFCGLCAEVCPTGAITMSGDYELAARDRRDLITRVSFPGRPGHAAPAPDPAMTAVTPVQATAAAGDRLNDRARRLLRRSLHLRHVDVGSDNAADWEFNALLNPIYDLQRFGIDVVASPRHADVLVVTGAVSHNSAVALRRTYEATPEPRLVVALGADACGGGLLRGGYATAGGVDQVVPVDVYIPGCPPRPQAILFGLLLAMDRLEQKVRYSETTVSPAPRTDE